MRTSLSRALSLAGLSVALTAAPAALSQPPDPPPRKSLGPPIGLGIFAAGGLAAGIALTVASKNQRHAALDLGRAISRSGGSCLSVIPDERCYDLVDKAHNVDTLHDASIGAFIGAAVFAASIVTYILWPMPRTAGASTTKYLRASPVIAKGQGGMLFSGAF